MATPADRTRVDGRGESLATARDGLSVLTYWLLLLLPSPSSRIVLSNLTLSGRQPVSTGRQGG